VKQFRPGANSKITYQGVEAAFKQLGTQASQKTIAAHLDVTTKGLRNWVKSVGAKSWKEVQGYYQTKGK
jgi:hypothetical protein